MKKEKCKCYNCKHYKYNEQWDAYYCEERNVWLDSKCGCKEGEEEQCYFSCWKRPDYPNMKKYKALLEGARKFVRDIKKEK